MPSRLAIRRERDADFSAVGTVGRRTGVTVPQGPRDEHGIEEINGLFSSPNKPSPLRNALVTESGGRPSTPSQTLSTGRMHRVPSLPRSTSPRKTGINGVARRSQALDLQKATPDSGTWGSGNDENVVAVSSFPTLRNNAHRFSPNTEKSPLRDITRMGAVGMAKSGRNMDRTKQETNTVRITPEPVGLAPEAMAKGSEATPHDADDALAIAPGFDDSDLNLQMEGDDGLGGTFHNSVPDHMPVYSEDLVRAPGTPPLPSIEDDEPTKANSRRKRKSDGLDRDFGSVPSDLADAKRTRLSQSPSSYSKFKAAANAQKISPSTTSLVKSSGLTKQRKAAVESNLSQKTSTRLESELDQIVEKVKARPGQSKSLYILRRETPADEGMTHTRSGRVVVKPLAYWRNERCVYGGSPGQASLADDARFPLNSIKEIIRTEDLCTNSVGKAKKKPKGHRGKTKAKKELIDDSDFEEQNAAEDVDAEDWESSIGTFRGLVSVWDTRHQAALEVEEESDLAYASAAIQTRDVPGSTFRYAKLLSSAFFGAGIVDLPPRGIKRPKNSRKMHMAFFVAKGRVTVQVGPVGPDGENRFSIGKGGFWQVPRGNQYSITNELDRPARIFFSQGCEVLPEKFE